MSDEPSIIFIGGWGRTGSTLLARLLATSPGVTNVGEIKYLWSRGLLGNSQCGCGSSVEECVFWSAVFERAGVVPSDSYARRMAGAVASSSLRRGIWRKSFSGDSDRSFVREEFTKLLGAIADESGANVIVDSSKDVSFLWAYPQGLRVALVHFWRTPAAVVDAWTDSARHRSMAVGSDAFPDFGSVRAVTYLYALNLMALFARPIHLRLERLTVDYESLVEDPERVVSGVGSVAGRLGVPSSLGSWELPADFGVQHSISGNPSRFDSRVKIRRDTRYRDRMKPWRRWLISLMCAPLSLIVNITKRCDRVKLRSQRQSSAGINRLSLRQR